MKPFVHPETRNVPRITRWMALVLKNIVDVLGTQDTLTYFTKCILTTRTKNDAIKKKILRNPRDSYGQFNMISKIVDMDHIKQSVYIGCLKKTYMAKLSPGTESFKLNTPNSSRINEYSWKCLLNNLRVPIDV